MSFGLTAGGLALVLAGGCSATGSTSYAPASPAARDPGALGPASNLADGVPAWAMHVKADRIDLGLSQEMVSARLLGELRRPRLSDGHLAGGQIALAAIARLDAGQGTDAAVLLSIASYRYEEEFHHLLHDGEVPPDGVNGSAYYRVVNRERDVYQHLNFDEQLQPLAAYLRGQPLAQPDLPRRLDNLFSGAPEREDAFSPTTRTAFADVRPFSEDLHAPDLASAFLERLRNDAGDKRWEIFVPSALTRTPLRRFQLDALRLGKQPLAFRLCRMIAEHIGNEQRSVTDLLSDPSSATRSNAAIVLGMLPSSEAISALEKRLAVETELPVRLSLAYALALHGQRRRVVDLTTGLRPCVGDPCKDSLILVTWLPKELRAGVDQAAIFAVVGDERQTAFARTLAAAILWDLTREGPLDPRAHDALLAAAGARDRQLSSTAAAALAADPSFSREGVLSRLRPPVSVYRPLLARLARVATSADLPLLAGLMPRFTQGRSDEAEALVKATARIGGNEAEALLLGWFDAYPTTRGWIVLALTAKKEVSPATLRHFAEHGDAKSTLLMKVVTGAPDAMTLLDRHLRAGSPGERLYAVLLAGAVRDPAAIDALRQVATYEDARYYPNDASLRHAAVTALLEIKLARLVPAASERL